MAYSISRVEANLLKTKVYQVMMKFEQVFPPTELSIVFHMVIHLADSILDWGPLSAMWLFANERYLHFLGLLVKNRRHVESSMVSMFCIFHHVSTLPDDIRESVSNVIGDDDDYLNPIFYNDVRHSSYNCHAVVFPIVKRPKYITLPQNDVLLINELLSSAYSSYAEVCIKYISFKSSLIVNGSIADSIPCLRDWVNSTMMLSEKQKQIAVGISNKASSFIYIYICVDSFHFIINNSFFLAYVN